MAHVIDRRSPPRKDGRPAIALTSSRTRAPSFTGPALFRLTPERRAQAVGGAGLDGACDELSAPPRQGHRD